MPVFIPKAVAPCSVLVVFFDEYNSAVDVVCVDAVTPGNVLVVC